MLVTRRPAKCIFRGNPLKNALLIAGLAAALSAAGGPALAQSGTWTSTSGGNWSTAGSWASNAIPGTNSGTTSTGTAWFSSNLAANSNVTVDTNRNIGSIIFDGTSNFGFNLTTGPLLLTSGGTVSSTGSVGARTDTISAPMTILGNNATYTISNDSTLATRLLSISGGVTGQSTTGGTTTLILGGNNSGTNSFTGALSSGTNGGTLALVKEGSTTWSLGAGARYAYSGPVTINGGTLLWPGSSGDGDVHNPLGNAPSITFANVAGATLDFGAAVWNRAGGLGSLSGGGPNGGNVVNTGYVTSGLSIGLDNTNTTFGGRFIPGTSAGSFRKVGTGTLTLTGSGNDAGSTWQINGGALGLNFSQAWTGTDILVSTRAVQFGGGRLLLTGSSGASNSQTVSGATVGAGNNGIALTSNGAAGLVLSLGAISRSAGGTLDVTLPDSTQSTTNGVRTSTTNLANNVFVSAASNGIAYATVSGTTWAGLSSGNIVALSSYATGAANYTSANNVDVGVADSPAADRTVNTLRFNAGPTVLTLSGTNTIGTGGMLFTPAMTSGTITGGSLRPGSGNELVLINNGGQLTVNSVIANNSAAAAVTLSGTGNFRLNGNNTYTGATRINSSTVSLGSATALGLSGSSAVWLADDPNAALDLNGYDISIGSLAGAGGQIGMQAVPGTAGGRVLLGANSLTAGADNTSTTYGGRITGSGAFTKVGTGNLTISGSSALAGFSGSLVVENGTLSVSNYANSVFRAEPLGTATVYLGKIGGGTANARLNLSGSTARPIELVAGNSGTMTIGEGMQSSNDQVTSISSSISGTGELVILKDTRGSSMSVRGLINHTGNLTLRRTNQFGAQAFTISGGIGSNVVNVTLDHAAANTIGLTISGTIAATGTIANNSSSSNSTQTINGTITSASRLVQNSALVPLVLNAANTFTGDTFLQSGTLRLGNNLALQNSGVDTSGAGVLTLSSVTTPTFGGLIGSKNVASVITTGYSNVTALTLNPQSGKSYTYSGNIANGAVAGMTLTKSGSGTQVLSGSNSYSGATTVSAGLLQFGRVNSLYGGTTANWTATNIRTGSGATLAFNVGGTDEFTTGNVSTLLTNLANSTSATNGMNAGSILGFDTTNAAGGTFTINDAIANSGDVSGGARGLRKLGTGILVLGSANSYTGATSVEGGTLAFGLVSALNSSSGIGINAGAILDYTGSAATLSRNVTVATSGTGTIRNSGGQKLTLSGTLTKDGRVLRLTGGQFDVTGQIVGASANSDLLVDGASTVTLLSANTYNGPTFVNGASTLVVGIANAIPNNSVVTLGDATTRGTLDLGTFTDAIGGLVFSGSGGTVKMAANQTSAAQLSSASALSLGSNSSLDLTGMQTSAGLYRLISASSLSGTFADVTGLNSNYVLRYGTVNANEISAQRKAEFGTITATPASATIIVGGTTAFGFTVQNSAPSLGADLLASVSTGSNVIGSASLGAVSAGATSSSVSGLSFTSNTVGLGQTGSFTLTDAEAIGSPAAGSVTVNVLNHSLASFAATDTAVKTLNFGTFDNGAWTGGDGGNGTLGYSIFNIASPGFTDAQTAGLDLYDLVFTSGDNIFDLGYSQFQNLASGSSNGFSASVLSPGSLIDGFYTATYTLKFRDQQNLSGAANTRDLQITLSANVIVVPEPGAIALAGIGIAAAAYAYRRRRA
jgi:fibronectin-binding autotransporter adhesin